MCKVFSSDGTGDMTFEDFLDMMSVFSDNAPKSVKVGVQVFQPHMCFYNCFEYVMFNSVKNSSVSPKSQYS